MAASMEEEGFRLMEHLLHDLSSQDLKQLTSDTLNDILTGDQFTHGSRCTSAKRYLDWARKNKNLKIVSDDVPVGILPVGVKGVLYDVRVFTRRGPDDAVYDAHRDIRDRVARGNSFLELEGGPHTGTTCVIYALKKFTGGLGDDDDRDKGDDHTWKKYFLKPLEKTTNIVALQKANGEAAHLSVHKIQGAYVLCGGSKNVHMMFRKRGDIEKYTGSRYFVAKQVCNTILDALDSMEPEEKLRLYQFLDMTKFTAVFEILNPEHQHVEDLSHLPKCLLQFICWTSTDLDPPTESKLCSMPPHVAIEVAKALRLPTVNYEVIPASELETRMDQIRQGYGFEGEVLYFLDKEQNVIGLLKKKKVPTATLR